MVALASGLRRRSSGNGHGLGTAHALERISYRLTVDVPETAALVKWSEWAPKNVTPETIANLHGSTGHAHDTWWVYFGAVPPTAILACVDMSTGSQVTNWGEVSPPEMDHPAISPSRANEWIRRRLRKARKGYYRHFGGKEAYLRAQPW